MSERISTAETRALEARKRAQNAQDKVTALRREANRAERKKRARMLIQLGIPLEALGFADPGDVQRFLSVLRSYSCTDPNTGVKMALLDVAVRRAKTTAAPPETQ